MAQKPVLGCGLIAIGRSWGTTPKIPDEKQAITFLEEAFEAGVRFFDTAPAYGLSEERLGIFLSSLSPAMLQETFIATKVGEHWDIQENTAYVDHTYEAMRKSLDASHQKLKKIDLLQLHKTSREVLASADVTDLFSYAKKQYGINTFGASVGDEDSLLAALADERLSYIQFPYNITNSEYGKYIPMANDAGKHVILNRPLQMGATAQNGAASVDEAFQFILREPFDGVVLTGTSNPSHLKDNLASFGRNSTRGL